MIVLAVVASLAVVAFRDSTDTVSEPGQLQETVWGLRDDAKATVLRDVAGGWTLDGRVTAARSGPMVGRVAVGDLDRGPGSIIRTFVGLRIGRRYCLPLPVSEQSNGAIRTLLEWRIDAVVGPSAPADLARANCVAAGKW